MTPLAAEFDKSSAPALFQRGNQGAINSYGDYCYPFDGTAIMDQMTTGCFQPGVKTAVTLIDIT